MSKMNTTQQNGLVESQPGLQLLTKAEASTLTGGGGLQAFGVSVVKTLPKGVSGPGALGFLVGAFMVGWQIGTYIDQNFIAPK